MCRSFIFSVFFLLPDTRCCGWDHWSSKTRRTWYDVGPRMELSQKWVMRMCTLRLWCLTYGFVVFSSNPSNRYNTNSCAYKILSHTAKKLAWDKSKMTSAGTEDLRLYVKLLAPLCLFLICIIVVKYSWNSASYNICPCWRHNNIKLFHVATNYNIYILTNILVAHV